MQWQQLKATLPWKGKPDTAATAALVVEQARALVQTEEARFTAAQARVTALLAVTGVLGGIGAGFLGSARSRDYTLIVAMIVGALGAVAILGLLYSSYLAVSALRKEPEPRSQSKKLSRVIEEGSPPLLDKTPHEAALAIIPTLAKQHKRAHKATEEVHEAFVEAARILAIAVTSGLAMSLLIVFASDSKPQDIQLVERTKNEAPIPLRATLEKR